MIKKSSTFEKQQSLYHNKVIPSLTPIQTLGNQAYNCKMNFFMNKKIMSLLLKQAQNTLILNEISNKDLCNSENGVWKLKNITLNLFLDIPQF